jgi:hypothetical protein
MPWIEDLPPFATGTQLEAFTKGKLRANDSRVDVALAAVSAEIRREAGWHIGPRVTGHVMTLDGPGGYIAALPTMKIHALTSITDAGETVDLTQVDVSRETGLIERRDGQAWSRRYGQLVVTLDHGWDRNDELTQLCLSLTARGLASPMGATREQAGALSVNWGMATQGVSGGILPTAGERGTIGRYKLAGVGR